MRRIRVRSKPSYAGRKTKAARHPSTLINNTFNEAGDMAVCDGSEIELEPAHAHLSSQADRIPSIPTSLLID